MTVRDALDLADYRRRVTAIYAVVRDSASPEIGWAHFRAERSALFRSHPQSPLATGPRADYPELPFFPYDPAFRVPASPEPAPDRQPRVVALAQDGELSLSPLATLAFRLPGGSAQLTLFRLGGYGGGLFLPLRDATSGTDTYGGGRYLLDTIKGADLGLLNGQLVLDFNYAYNPSCAYSPAWHCPLAPIENLLKLPIRAGELTPP